MKKVEFVRVESKLNGFGIGKGVKYVFADIREIIEKKYKEDYAYKGYVPVETRGTGDITVIDLIFEKE